jgi:hypothetical protein
MACSAGRAQDESAKAEAVPAMTASARKGERRELAIITLSLIDVIILDVRGRDGKARRRDSLWEIFKITKRIEGEDEEE